MILSIKLKQNHYYFISLFLTVLSPRRCEGLSLVVESRGSSPVAACGLSSRDSRALEHEQFWCTGSVAPRQVGWSRTRDRTRVSCVGRGILNHWATREAPNFKLQCWERPTPLSPPSRKHNLESQIVCWRADAACPPGAQLCGCLLTRAFLLDCSVGQHDPFNQSTGLGTSTSVGRAVQGRAAPAPTLGDLDQTFVPLCLSLPTVQEDLPLLHL